MKYTLLELVQSVLSSMDSDEVNSISDTVESLQVTEVIKTVYDDIISRSELAIQKTLFNLEASGSALKPVLMIKPATIDSIEWIRYNKIILGDTDPRWEEIRYMPLDSFLMMTQNMSPSETDTDAMTHIASGFTLTFHFKNNTGPQYYTTFDDNTIIFDAYDAAVDTTLQASKSLCYGTLSNVFVQTDGFVPNLQPHQFPLLLNEAKALAWAELKQTEHKKAEASARRNWIHLAKTRKHIPHPGRFAGGGHPFDALPNFSRK